MATERKATKPPAVNSSKGVILIVPNVRGFVNQYDISTNEVTKTSNQLIILKKSIDYLLNKPIINNIIVIINGTNKNTPNVYLPKISILKIARIELNA